MSIRFGISMIASTLPEVLCGRRKLDWIVDAMRGSSVSSRGADSEHRQATRVPRLRDARNMRRYADERTRELQTKCAHGRADRRLRRDVQPAAA